MVPEKLPPSGLLREIGSDMELVTSEYCSESRIVPPWESLEEPVKYLETGSQALTLIARKIWQEGFRTILLPEYLCESMVHPFTHHLWSIKTYPVLPDLDMDLDGLVAHSQSIREPFAVLTALYFGRGPREHHRSVVAQIRQCGGVVIDDETHRVFNPGGMGADFAIASLRKLLPLGDGAYIRAKNMSEIEEPSEVGDGSRWLAMDQKAIALEAAAGDRNFVSTFARENAALESRCEPRRMSDRSREALYHLKFHDLELARRRNAEALEVSLADNKNLEIVNPVSKDLVPSHLLVRLANPREVQGRLAKQGIYCPIHWPPPTLLPARAAWPNDVMSVPVDHRYTPGDMQRVASELTRALT